MTVSNRLRENPLALHARKLSVEARLQWHSIRDEFPPEAYGLGEAMGT
jgi:hypothetical protein